MIECFFFFVDIFFILFIVNLVNKILDLYILNNNLIIPNLNQN